MVDESLDLPLMPRLTVAELDTRGDTELASVIVPLKSVVAADAASAVKKLMKPEPRDFWMLLPQQVAQNHQRLLVALGGSRNSRPSNFARNGSCT
jgi:hypothetical protein